MAVFSRPQALELCAAAFFKRLKTQRDPRDREVQYEAAQ